MIIDLYTDGGCIPNPGRGAYAAVAQMRGETDKPFRTGGFRHTTNNRMEIYGVIHGLEMVYELIRRAHVPQLHIEIQIFSDSQYVIKAFKEHWIEGWKRRNWQRKQSTVPNADLWKRLDALVACPPPRVVHRWNWLRGHTGVAGNEHCDDLCLKTIQQPGELEIDHPYESGKTVASKALVKSPVWDNALLSQKLADALDRLDALEKEVFGPAVDCPPLPPEVVADKKRAGEYLYGKNP